MRLQRNSLRNKSWFTSKWFLVLILIVFLLITIALVKEFYRSHQINKEISQLQEEIQQLEGKNNEFSEFVEFLKTDVYLEEQARVKLGMKAPGEKVVVLKEGEDNAKYKDNAFAEQSTTSLVASEKGRQKNSSKWWSYFWGISS